MHRESLASPAALPLTVSERSYPATPTVDRHAFHQIVLPCRGRLEMQIAEQRGYAGERWFAFVPCEIEHRYWAGGPNRFLILELAPALLVAAEQELNQQGALPTRAFPPLDERMVAFGRLLQVELTRGELAEPLIAESLGRYASSLLLTPRIAPASLGPSPNGARRLATRTRDLLDAAYEQPLSLGEIAATLDASVSHIQRSFRAHFGTTIVAYLHERRLARARELLLGSDLSIIEIAFAAGFNDHSYFTRLFTREVGLSPSSYRDSIRAETDKNLRRSSKTAR